MPFLGARGQASRGYFGGGTPPDAPTAVVATRGNTQLSVAFSAPAFNGGLDITTYQYALSTDSYATWTTRSTGTTASPLVITGLANGTSYQVKLRAVNALGAGAASDASTAVTPATIPGTPTSPSISSGNGSISVSWGAPLSDGGDPPLTYTVETQKNSEAWVNRGTQTSPYALSSLDNGQTYRARISAVNTVGSSATPAVTGDTVPSTVPNAPTTTSSVGDRSYTVNWTAPANNGSAIDYYEVQITDADEQNWSTIASPNPGPTATSQTFDSLTNGKSYRTRVRAHNSRGFGSYVESTSRIPTFAAPGFSANGDYRSSANRTVRKIAWAIDPTNIVNGATTTTYVYIQWMVADGTFSNSYAAEELVTTYTGTAYQSYEQTSFVNSGTVVAGEQYRMRAVQYDGTHAVGTSYINITVIALANDAYEWVYTNGVNLYTTGTFNVNGGSYAQVSTSVIPGVNTQNANDTQYELTVLNVTATGASSSSASTGTRYFRVQYAGTNDATSGNPGSMPTVLNTSTDSNTWPGAGNNSMEYSFNVSNIGYGYAGYGKVKVDGLGISSWSPNINVVIEARGNKRQWTAYNY